MLLALGAGAEMVPDDEENYRGGENKRGDGVDLRSNATAEAAPDFQRQCVVAADEEECDRDFVHGERENEETGGNEREREQNETPEQSPTGEIGAVESKSGQQAEQQGNQDGSSGDQKAVQDGVPDR